jgi:hypothetical protein
MYHASKLYYIYKDNYLKENNLILPNLRQRPAVNYQKKVLEILLANMNLFIPTPIRP